MILNIVCKAYIHKMDLQHTHIQNGLNSMSEIHSNGLNFITIAAKLEHALSRRSYKYTMIQKLTSEMKDLPF